MTDPSHEYPTWRELIDQAAEDTALGRCYVCSQNPAKPDLTCNCGPVPILICSDECVFTHRHVADGEIIAHD